MRIDKAEPEQPRALVLVPDPRAGRPGARRDRPAGRGARASPSSPSTAAPPWTARSRPSSAGVDIMVATPGRLIDLGRPRRARRRRRADPRARRGRPHGRHGLHAPGRVDPAPHRPASTRRCCSRPPSTATSTTSSRTTCTTRSRHEVESTTATVDQMKHRFLNVHEMDKVKVAATIAKSSDRTLDLRPDQARRRPPGRAAQPGRRQGRRHPRRPAPSPSAQRALKQIRRRQRCPCSSPPTSPPAASTSTASTWSSTTTRRRTTRPTCTARAAPPGPAPPASPSPSRCGTRRSRSSACRSGCSSTRHFVEVFSNDERLADLGAWEPEERAPHANAEAAAAPGATRLAQARRVGGGGGRGRGKR